MSNNQAMEKQYSVQFFTTFVANLQKLCQAYVKFDRNVEVSGYVCVEVDNSKKERYVLSELIQNCGSVVSESYCTKVFRTLPMLNTPQNAAKQDGMEPWPLNSSSTIGSERPRPRVSQERRGSISSNKSNDSYPEGRESEYGVQSTYNSDVPEPMRMTTTQRSKRLSFDHDKENAARLSRDIIQRLTGESPSRASMEQNRNRHQVQRRESLPSFAHISGRVGTAGSSQSSPMEVMDLESIKVEGSRLSACAQAKPQSVPSSPIGQGEGYPGIIPVGIHANLSNLGHVVESFAASRTQIAQPAHSSTDRFPRLSSSSSSSISSSQPIQSSSILSQSHVPGWSPPDSARSRVSSASRQQEVFMQMLPQGYDQDGSKQSVQMIDPNDSHQRLVDGASSMDPSDVIDLEIDEMDPEATNSSIADVNPSLGLAGIDQSVLSDYMMSSAQATDVQRKRNAQLNCQRYALRLFCEFHQSQAGSMPSLDSISSEQMDAMLSVFYATSKKGNGEDFTVSSLRSIQYYLESHLFENYIQAGSRAIVFKNSRQALRKRCEELRTKQKSTPLSKKALTSLDIDILFEKGQLGASSPDVLLNTLWFMNVICFGIKGSEHFSLRWGDIILNTDKEGRQFLEYSGSGSSSQNSNCHRVYALPQNPSRCCVHYFKQYLSHRPTIALQPDDPFYLSVNNQYERVGSWYIKEKVSMSRMTAVWRNMLFAAGLPPDKKTPAGFQKGLLIQETQAPTQGPTPIMQFKSKIEPVDS